MKSRDHVDVTAQRLAADGHGICDSNGCAVHVADLLPGERAEVEIEHASPHKPVAWGRIVARQGELSADRVEPACRAFGRCGGCQWQHLAYAAQLVAKRQQVVDELQAAGLDVEVAATVPAPRQTHYRNKATFVVATDDRGAMFLGAYAPRSHEVVDTTGCAVITPALASVSGLALDALRHSGLRAFDERQRTGEARYVVMRANRDERIGVVLVTTGSAPAEAVRAAAVELAADPAVIGVSWNRNDARSAAILSGDSEVVAGEAALPITIGGVDLEVDATAFLQVNWDCVEALYEHLAGELDVAAGDRVVDLYSGVGGIAITLAARGANVVGVERHRGAVDAANAAAARAGLSWRAVAGDAAALASIAHDTTAVTVNPPRKGLDSDTRAALIALAPPRIGYVSCSPETLGRDLAELRAAGYRVGAVTPFDLMPGTSQVECVVVVRR